MSSIESYTVRTGFAFKKGSKRGLFGRANWKPRQLELTSSELCYYTIRNRKLKGRVDLSQCTDRDIEIMPKDCRKTGRSKSSVWRVAIRTPERRFVLAALSESDMNEWIEALEAVVQRRPSSSCSSDASCGSSSSGDRASFLRESSKWRNSARTYKHSTHRRTVEVDTNIPIVA